MAVAGETTLEYTPTWVVAAVCTVIVSISLGAERILHYAGKYLKKKDQKPLYEALLKIKEGQSLFLFLSADAFCLFMGVLGAYFWFSVLCSTVVVVVVYAELMLLGFISLLLTVFQDTIAKICIPKRYSDDWLPCKKKKEDSSSSEESTSHFQTFYHFTSGGARRLLAEHSASPSYCAKRKVIVDISQEKEELLKIFIIQGGDMRFDYLLVFSNIFTGKGPTFIYHSFASSSYLYLRASSCACDILCSNNYFGGAKIRQWKHWEDAISKKEYDPEEVLKFTNVREHDFIKDRYRGVGKIGNLRGWVRSFFKQFYASVTRSDYVTMRMGFIMTHCRGNPKFNFHKYMIRALEADFKRVVGISWYLWIFVVVFLLLNVKGVDMRNLFLAVTGWHAYFWIAFIPFIHVCRKDDAPTHYSVILKIFYFLWGLSWSMPQIVLFLIQIILFQNSFELAFFFWIWVQYGFDSCIMGQLGFIIPRLFIGAFVQFLCSYSTLPLYAIVAQMGSSFKRSIFEEHIQHGLVEWAHKAKLKTGFKKNANGPSQVGPKEVPPPAVQLAEVVKESAEEKGNVGEIHPATGSGGSK
ncbi:MLO-like protein 1 [Vitis vinifera]|uniref:MLO-like protein n=2 Tax=Vitis vinifera TaxID=29760 RepID=A0A438GA05_VITVI|nr:MLO-like protein 1 [Vitis vinifera]